MAFTLSKTPECIESTFYVHLVVTLVIFITDFKVVRVVSDLLIAANDIWDSFRTHAPKNS